MGRTVMCDECDVRGPLLCSAAGWGHLRQHARCRPSTACRRLTAPPTTAAAPPLPQEASPILPVLPPHCTRLLPAPALTMPPPRQQRVVSPRIRTAQHTSRCHASGPLPAPHTANSMVRHSDARHQNAALHFTWLFVSSGCFLSGPFLDNWLYLG